MEKISFLLQPLSWLFGQIVQLRQFAYARSYLSSYHSPLTVICVGNIIAGGSGKTPFVHYLCSLLSENSFARSQPVSILSRGYGGSITEATQVTPAHSTKEVGDEAFLHFQKRVSAQVVIARKRAEGVKLIEARQLAQTVVLDDGYQHFALQRDINFLLLDCSSPEAISRWSSDTLLPKGLQRETLANGIARATAIILIDKRCDEISKEAVVEARRLIQKETAKSLPTFNFRLQPTKLVDLVSGDEFELSALAGMNCSVFTAIANPSSFLTLLKRNGALFEDRVFSFRDHHEFRPQEVAQALENTVPLITTEKDAVKLSKHISKVNQCYVLSLDGDFADDKSEFLSFLNRELKNTTVETSASGQRS